MNSKKQTKLNSEELTVAHNNYNKSLNSYAFFKVNDKSTGEDLVQDTFKKTWIFLVKGGKISMMRAFLYHILNNLIVDEYRRKKNKAESLNTLIDNGFEPKDDQSESLVNFLDGKAALLRIGELPEKYKKIMHMRFVQCMSLDDISKAIGETKNNTAVQIHRGLKKLKLLCEPKD